VVAATAAADDDGNKSSSNSSSIVVVVIVVIIFAGRRMLCHSPMYSARIIQQEITQQTSYSQCVPLSVMALRRY